MKRDTFTLYGLCTYEETIDNIINGIDCNINYFDIKLILTEALSNAFKHGNESDEDKPIYLNYEYTDEYIRFEVKDSGSKQKNIEILDEVLDKDLYNNSGRGLYLLSCIADKVYFEENSMIIKKYLKEGEY